MRSDYTITLFSKRPQREAAPSAFVVSIVLHSCVFLLLLASMRRVTVVDRRLADRKYAVHLLDIRESMASARWYPAKNAARQKSNSRGGRRAGSAGAKRSMPKISREMRVASNFATPKPAPQTLIQPEVPPDRQVLPELPIPQAMVWTAGEIKHKKIVPPEPPKPGAVRTRPSLEKPNHELNPAEVPLSSIPLLADARMPLAGTTSPVKVEAPTPAKQAPQTPTKDAAQEPAARVLALSKNRLQMGTAALPVVNEIAQADTVGSPVLADVGSETPGSDKTEGRNAATGTGSGAAKDKGDGDGASIGTASKGQPGAGFSVDTGTGSQPAGGFTVATGEGNPSEEGTSTAPEHITLPKNGQYGMVIVGASPEGDYPQTADLWTGRLVYTVYLQTDTAQNWILQYSLKPSQSHDANVESRPDAPWPFDMLRPSLDPYKDIVMVHGFVTAAGRFEQLSVAYPPSFAGSDMLLRSLKRWEFRPAMIQGQPATVEVLLIIPGEAD